MAISQSRKAAPRAPVFSSEALRMTALRVRRRRRVIGLGAGLLALNARQDQVARRDVRQAAVAVAKAPAVETPHAEPRRLPNAEPPRREASADSAKPMSAALRAAFDAWLMASYAKCWRAPKTLPDGDPYCPRCASPSARRPAAGPPRLVNPRRPGVETACGAALKASKVATRSTFPTNTPNITPLEIEDGLFRPTRN